jgi:hypothetical protein
VASDSPTWLSDVPIQDLTLSLTVVVGVISAPWIGHKDVPEASRIQVAGRRGAQTPFALTPPWTTPVPDRAQSC